MKIRYSVSGLLLMFNVASASTLNTVEVVVQNFDELKAAINEANERPLDTATIFYLTPPILVPNDDALPPIRARMNFEVGAFRVEDGGPERFIQVDSTGILGIRDMTFSGWKQHTAGPVLFENRGRLVLRRVTFDTVVGYRYCGKFSCNDNDSAVIHNAPGAHALLDGVRVYDQDVSLHGALGEGPRNRILHNQGHAELVRTHFYPSYKRMRAPIFNSGNLEFRNASFMVANPIAVPQMSLLSAEGGAGAHSVNSVFDGFVGDLCEVVSSSGHNTVSAHDCSWSTVGDDTGARTGLVWRSVPGSYDQKLLVPSAASSLVDSADPEQCATDIPGSPSGIKIQDGNGDGQAVCDRGAWELEPIGLAEGGINGFYYNPVEDGHYVYIQETDFTTLVMWNTFDSDGNQAWIYGTGKLESGRAVVAEAYINRTGGLTPDGLVTDVEAVEWGQLIVELESCGKGLVDYRSVFPEFGSGQFPIERLANVKQLGCSDPE